MGNVQFLLDWSGKGVEKYTYDAFGQPKITAWNGTVRTTSAYGNRFMFTGREYLAPLGLYDYRHRFYHPGLGRFLQTDPIGFASGDANLFRYCAGNPVNRSDPSGLASSNDTIPYWPNEPATMPAVNVTAPFLPGIDPSGNGLFSQHNGQDWGSFGDVVNYFTGGDHGLLGGGFNGFGDRVGLGGGAFNPTLNVQPLPPSPNVPQPP